MPEGLSPPFEASRIETRTRLMRTVCAWCRRSLGRRRVRASVRAAVSHGLCRPCARRLAAR